MSSRDEIAAARRRKRREYRKKRLKVILRVAAVVAVAALCVLLIASAELRDVKDFFKTTFSSGEYPVELSNVTPEQINALSSAWCVRAGREIMVFSGSGARLSRITPEYADVGLAAQGNRLFVYNAGGTQAQMYNRTELLFEVEAPAEIISGTTGGARRAALLCTSERYAGELVIYVLGGEVLMSWYCASNFPYLAVFDRDASHVAVCAMYIEGGVFGTEITVIDVNKKEEVLKTRVSCAAISVALNNTELTVVGDTRTVQLDAAGERVAEYVYDERTLLTSAREKNGGIALAFGDNDKARINSIVWLDKQLQELCDIEIGAPVKDVRLSGSRLYVLTDTDITQYTPTGNVAKSAAADYNAVALMIKGRVIEILPDSAVEITLEG